ncbi:MAG: hypothetical protein JWM27_4555 [Gemmatimonadetes bacterium]|nr:hypothetical protein [Gemmatimonadota bacterium]
MARPGRKTKADEPQPEEAPYPLPAPRTGRVRDAGTAYEPGAPEALRKKNYRLRQSTIDRAMKLLGTRTETETIEQALDLVVFRSELVEGVRAMRGADLRDVFGADA